MKVWEKIIVINERERVGEHGEKEKKSEKTGWVSEWERLKRFGEQMRMSEKIIKSAIIERERECERRRLSRERVWEMIFKRECERRES